MTRENYQLSGNSIISLFRFRHFRKKLVTTSPSESFNDFLEARRLPRLIIVPKSVSYSLFSCRTTVISDYCNRKNCSKTGTFQCSQFRLKFLREGRRERASKKNTFGTVFNGQTSFNNVQKVCWCYSNVNCVFFFGWRIVIGFVLAKL